MTEFSTTGQLELDLDDRSLRGIERDIERGLSDIEVGMDSSTSSMLANDVNGGGGFGTDDTLQAAILETLDDIHDEIKKLGTSMGAGGGRGGGGFFSLLGRFAGATAGGLGTAGIGVGSLLLGGLGGAGGMKQLEDQGLLQDSGVPDWLSGTPGWWDQTPIWLKGTPEWWSRSVPALQETSPGQNINPDMERVRKRAKQMQAAREMRETPGQNIVPNTELLDNTTSTNYGRNDQQGNFQSDQRLFNRAEQNRRNRAEERRRRNQQVNVNADVRVEDRRNADTARKVSEEVRREVEKQVGKELDNIGP